ncbi:MAG: cadherin-like beta sandwich domain-containing protein [Lachnospiraceae bacterium]|nr:cadherin-like beta sandwich domain-containing protein [Lachnospiraceae bacterium]
MMFRKKKGLRVVSMLLLVSLLMFYGGESIQTVCATETTQMQGSDAYLKTLTASPGTMTPSFSPMVTSYTVTVPADVDKLNVTCSTADANATVTEAKGFKDLKMGNNTAVIKVKGPSGTICSYNITIVRGNLSEATNPAEGAGITLATNPSTTNSTTQTPAPQPTTDVSTDLSNTQESVNNDNSVDTTETDPSETDAGTETTETDATETDGLQAVPIMAELPGSGERYLIGGDSIYADYYVTSTFDTSLLPEGFVVEPYNFNGATVQSAYLAAGDIRLLYSESEEGSNAGLRIYYEDDKDVLDFVPFLGYNGYVFPVRYQAQIPVPLNYTGSYMPFEKKVVSCYIYTELTGNPLSVQEGMETKDTLQPGESTADADPVMVDTLDEMPEFYLFYGMNNSGEENFYLYDWKEGTYQRYVERDTSYDLDQSYFKYKDMSHQRFVIMCILSVLLLLAIFVIVNLYMKNRELKRDLEEYDPDFSGEDDDSDSYDDVRDDDDDNDDDNEDDDEDIDEDSDASDLYNTDQDDSASDAFADDFSQSDVKETDVENDIDDDLIKEQFPIHVSPEMFEEDDGMPETKQPKEEAIVQKEATGSIRRPEFKMINLSRESEPSGIDDDFEFEFIHFEDD